MRSFGPELLAPIDLAHRIDDRAATDYQHVGHRRLPRVPRGKSREHLVPIEQAAPQLDHAQRASSRALARSTASACAVRIATAQAPARA